MNKAQRKRVKKWTDALRSGEYQQGTGQLRTEESDGTISYCCLGLLDTLNGEKFDDGDGGLSVDAFEKITGIPDVDDRHDTWQDHLAFVNDGDTGHRATFNVIAVSIDRRAEKVHPGWKVGL